MLPTYYTSSSHSGLKIHPRAGVSVFLCGSKVATRPFGWSSPFEVGLSPGLSVCSIFPALFALHWGYSHVNIFGLRIMLLWYFRSHSRSLESRSGNWNFDQMEHFSWFHTLLALHFKFQIYLVLRLKWCDITQNYIEIWLYFAVFQGIKFQLIVNYSCCCRASQLLLTIQLLSIVRSGNKIFQIWEI